MVIFCVSCDDGFQQVEGQFGGYLLIMALDRLIYLASMT